MHPVSVKTSPYKTHLSLLSLPNPPDLLKGSFVGLRVMDCSRVCRAGWGWGFSASSLSLSLSLLLLWTPGYVTRAALGDGCGPRDQDSSPESAEQLDVIRDQGCSARPHPSVTTATRHARVGHLPGWSQGHHLAMCASLLCVLQAGVSD